MNLCKKKCIIFEDSVSGYISAKNTDIFKICLFVNSESSHEIIESNEFKFKNYNDLNLDVIINSNEDKYIKSKLKYINLMKDKLGNLPISDIIFNNINLKTGYICDIDSYKVIYYNNNCEDIVLKISNFDNELSKTAKKLNMYENEAYFYESISNLVCEVNVQKILE